MAACPCLPSTARPSPCPIHHAINSGVPFIDTSDAYGPQTHEIRLGKRIILKQQMIERYKYPPDNVIRSLAYDLDFSNQGDTILVRVLRIWEARNLRKERELMSMDFLLLDEKDGIIQGSIPAKHIGHFKEQINEGGVFAISNFDKVKTGPLYKLTDHKVMIRFNEETTLKKCSEENHPIQLEKFCFRTFRELLDLADKKEELPDVIGYICEEVRKPAEGTAGVPRRVLLRLQLEDGVKVCVTIWEDMIDNFFEKLTKAEEKTIIIIVTSVNSKTFGRDLFLNTTSSTKFYLNPEFAIVRDFRDRTKGKSPEISVVRGQDHSTPSRAAKNIPEILGYVSAHNRENEFICVATVKAIDTRNGWNYIACSACSKKIEKTKTSLSCLGCNKSQAIGILRFRIVMKVDDGNASTTFVLFDREAKKIINKSASEITNDEEASDENHIETETLPGCVRAIVGRTFTFQIKVTAYNFTAIHQSFTVSRILDENTKESEKAVLGDAENLKGKKRDRGEEQSHRKTDDEALKETTILTAGNEDPEKRE